MAVTNDSFFPYMRIISSNSMINQNIIIFIVYCVHVCIITVTCNYVYDDKSTTLSSHNYRRELCHDLSETIAVNLFYISYVCSGYCQQTQHTIGDSFNSVKFPNLRGVLFDQWPNNHCVGQQWKFWLCTPFIIQLSDSILLT